MRKKIRSENAVRKGHMRKAVFSRAKFYFGSGVVVLLIGVKDRRLADGENPGKYFHLVSGGTKPHDQPNAVRLVRPGVAVRKPLRHPGSRPRGIRDYAFRVGVPKMSATFAKKSGKAYEKELGRSR